MMLQQAKILCATAALVFVSNFQLLEANALTVNVPAGTRVPVMLPNTITSNSVKTSDTINVAVAQDVMVNGHIVFKQGSPATVNVERARASGKFGRSGLLDLNGGMVTDISGNKQPFNIAYSAKGRSRRPFSVTMTILSVPLILAFGLGLITLPIAIMTSGKDAKVGEGLILDAITTSASDIQVN